jgi:integrase
LAIVLAGAKKTIRFANARRNLVIVRIACCCGLCVSEIGGLELDHVVVDVTRPHLRLRRETTKGKRERLAPAMGLHAAHERIAASSTTGEPFGLPCHQIRKRAGVPPKRHHPRHAIRRRFLTACKVLGLARARTLTIHHGRHTFISHALVPRLPLRPAKAPAIITTQCGIPLSARVA